MAFSGLHQVLAHAVIFRVHSVCRCRTWACGGGPDVGGCGPRRSASRALRARRRRTCTALASCCTRCGGKPHGEDGSIHGRQRLAVRATDGFDEVLHEVRGRIAPNRRMDGGNGRGCGRRLRRRKGYLVVMKNDEMRERPETRAAPRGCP